MGWFVVAFLCTNHLFQPDLRADPVPGSRCRGGCGSACLQETPEQGLRRQTRSDLANAGLPWLPEARMSHGGDKQGPATSHSARGDARRGSPSPRNAPGSCISPYRCPQPTFSPSLPPQQQLCPLRPPAQTAAFFNNACCGIWVLFGGILMPR